MIKLIPQHHLQKPPPPPVVALPLHQAPSTMPTMLAEPAQVTHSCRALSRLGTPSLV
jgi:hypothetical protein